MYKYLFLKTILGLFISLSAFAQERYDVVIYGGTPAGMAAAIQSSRMGLNVALLEQGDHIGGMLIEGLGGSDIDNHPSFQNSPAVGGIALEFYRRIAKAYQRDMEFEHMIRNRLKKPELWRFEPKVAEKVIKDWMTEVAVDVRYRQLLDEGDGAVTKRKNRIQSIRTTDGEVIRGKIFIDATVEGDLLAAAGVSNVVGRESNDKYGEIRNGIREHTTHAQFTVKVDAFRVPGDPESGTIHSVLNEPLGEPGEGDHRIQAYCFRVCLTDVSENRVPFSRPANYKRSNYEIYLRYLRAGGKLYTPIAHLPNRKTDLGAWHDLSHNLYGMNHGYPSGTYQERDSIFRYHADFTKGLFYFFANDSEVGELNSLFQREWARWGLAKDEFIDNDGWPRKFYIRDARRMISDYVITEHHVEKHDPIPVSDPVAMAYWPPDVHSVRRIVENGQAYNEGFVFGGDWWAPFGISYRALVPKRAECINLITPTCPSSSHIAYGAIRIEFTFMALGQAAATAAAIAINQRCAVQAVPYEQLNKLLLSQNQVLGLTGSE